MAIMGEGALLLWLAVVAMVVLLGGVGSTWFLNAYRLMSNLFHNPTAAW
jgi:hypothetical protein